MPGDSSPSPSRHLPILEQAELVLRLPAAERLKFVLDAPKPMPLVRALPDGDFYLTVREVGPQEALPLLAWASATQIGHLLDLESWRRDRFDPLRCGAWIALLHESGEATLRRAARTLDDETLILLLRDWARVRPLEIDHEEPTRGHGVTDVGDERGFTSPDGGYLLAPERAEHASAARQLTEILFLDDAARYFGLVRAALFELPSELEETALRWRASRLEEHGYPSFEEALSIYAPPAGAPADAADGAPAGSALDAPRSSVQMMGPASLVLRGVDALPTEERERILFGFNALANRVLVADGADAGSVESHRAVVGRAGSYVGIALEARGARDPGSAARILGEVPPIELFREGYARAAALQSQARSMLAAGWGHRHARALALVDTPLRARVAALLLPRPAFVALSADEPSDPRDFGSLAEIDETRVTVELCEALGEVLLARRGVDPAEVLDRGVPAFGRPPTFGTLLLTALAWHAARGQLRIEPLPPDVAADFLRTTASRRTADPAAAARAMDRLCTALDREAGLSARAAAALRVFGARCLDRLAADCGPLDPSLPLTARVVGCLRIEESRAG